MRLELIDPARKARRYYELRLSRTLFGDIALERRWGRIQGRRGSERIDLFADAREAAAAYRMHRRKRAANGYSRVSP